MNKTHLLSHVLRLTLLMLLVNLLTTAAELNIARQGIVKNVPLQDPYNGCLIVREGPGMEYPVKGHVVNGDTVTIEGTSGNWFKISSPKSGYVWASYIAVTDFDTIDSGSLGKPLPLEMVVEGAKPETLDQKLPERQKLLEDNIVIEVDIDREITP
ncbi:MAG: hypothetical protein CVV42_12095 [Candidatus Riflebacteria bacterium HGW-Riflebacteria-2]|jgi:hypothetical protein|nr:MAG: hypothetical protein CVV42_12095 [Candidatus Riflebacteria bacterium HGW-Riflebacteria-2]